jgi:polyamine ABC transporter, ATP-binding protein
VPLCGGGLLYCGPLFRPAPGPIGFNEERKMGETILELQNIAKHFGDTDVLNGISISIGKGEFITLLGPSGCGKTTTLRIIAGLETPDEGRVILNGQDVTDSEPNKRDVNTVFQNYALFPHMTVAANIGYSLKLKKRPKDEIKKAVDDALALVQLSGYGKRMPAELSGGQRQRVAIARAVVNRPSVLLLDEPLGALDLQLRRQMQLELKALQKQLGITFIYITHDQEEALNMSDRIAVMKDGRFEQLGTPAEVYDSPRTSYVARFVGTANVLTGTVEAVEDDVLKVACAGGCAGALRRGYSFAPGAPITLAVRSEHVEFTKDPAACGIAAVIREKTFAGGMLRIALELSDGTTLIASRHGIDMDVQTGDAVRVTWAPASAVPVDVDVEAEEAK